MSYEQVALENFAPAFYGTAGQLFCSDVELGEGGLI